MMTQELVHRTKKHFWKKWSIAFKIMPLVVIITVLKFLSHRMGFEIMELNALFTSLVGGTIFLLGFLISGVLTDYKESEKIPSEMVASLRTLMDDVYTIYKTKNSETAIRFVEFQKTLLNELMDWFYKKEKTKSILEKISNMNNFFIEFEKEDVPPAYIVKLKNEQNNLRKILLRIDTIRDTEFVGSAYAIVEAMGFVIAFGLIIMKIEPFYASLFFTIFVTYLIFYMFLLMKDLDNPFEYATHGENGTEISLKPLHDFKNESKDLK